MTREEREEAIKRLKKVKSIIGLSVSEKMSLDMAIKALGQEPCPNAIRRTDMLDAIGHGASYTSEELQRIIKGLPPVNPQPKTDWIPVSEELPKKNMPCLVSVGKLYLTQIAIYSDLMGTIDHKIFYQGDYGDRNFENITQYVRAWMPLPKPYQPQESEEV